MNTLYQAALAAPWAIEQSWIPIILNAAAKNGDIELAEEKREAYSLQMVEGKPLDGTVSTVVRDGVAIISVVGPIIPRATLFSRISAITSTDLIAQDLKQAVAASNVNSIILYMDTPGGAAKFINELSEYIYSLRTAGKTIKTYVAGSCDSGGYWLGSSTSEIIIDATADLGSIGVVMAGKKTAPKKGEIEWEIVSSRAPKKRLDPTSTDGAEDYLRIINSLEDVFFNTVARNMGVSIKAIANDFGQGSILVGKHAITAGMAHRIGNLEDLIKEMSSEKKHSRVNTVSSSSEVNTTSSSNNDTESIELNNSTWDLAAEKAGVKLQSDNATDRTSSSGTVKKIKTLQKQTKDSSEGGDWDAAAEKAGIKLASPEYKELNDMVLAARPEDSPKLAATLLNGLNKGKTPGQIAKEMIYKPKNLGSGDIDKAAEKAGIELKPSNIKESLNG